MNNPGSLKITTRGERELVMTRGFNAPRRLVFDAFTKPDESGTGCSDLMAGQWSSVRLF